MKRALIWILRTVGARSVQWDVKQELNIFSKHFLFLFIYYKEENNAKIDFRNGCRFGKLAVIFAQRGKITAFRWIFRKRVDFSEIYCLSALSTDEPLYRLFEKILLEKRVYENGAVTEDDHGAMAAKKRIDGRKGSGRLYTNNEPEILRYGQGR